MNCTTLIVLKQQDTRASRGVQIVFKQFSVDNIMQKLFRRDPIIEKFVIGMIGNEVSAP